MLAGATCYVMLAGAPGPVHAVDFVFASPSAVEGLQRRDEAMSFKCKGGMMDCDGDRRDYARNQWKNFTAKADGGGDTTCKARLVVLRCSASCLTTPAHMQVEEACTQDIFGAAVSGLNGLTTGEKLEKLGRDASSMVNSTTYEP